MYKEKRKILFSVLLLFFSLAPLVDAAAQTSTFAFGGVVPCGRAVNDDRTPNLDESVPCTLCHFVIGIQRMLSWGLTIFIPIGILMLTIAGVMYSMSAGNKGMMDTSKHFISSVVIGMGFILVGWLLITTMLNVLGVRLEKLSENSTSSIVVEKWYKFSCNATSSARR